MDALQLSLPRLVLTDEVSDQQESHHSHKRVSINRELWFVDDSQSRVVLFRHEAIYQAALNDARHLRFIAVNLHLSGHATQQEIADAFGHSVRTQRAWETQFQKEGLAGLLRRPGSGRRSRIQSSQDILLRKWFEQGATRNQMAQRLGVSLDVVKRALARLGLRRRPRTQPTFDWNQEQDIAAVEESEQNPDALAERVTPSAKPAPATNHESSALPPATLASSESFPQVAPQEMAREPVVVTVGGGPVVVAKVGVIRVPVSEVYPVSVPKDNDRCSGPAEQDHEDHQGAEGDMARVEQPPATGFTIDRDPTDRSGDRALARLGFLEDAVPLFAEANHLPRVGVMLAVPLLVKHGLVNAFQKVYGRSLGPSFYGLRTLVVVLFLSALLRIKRPEQFKEHAPWELGRLFGLDRAAEVKTVRRKLSRLAEQKRAPMLMQEMASRRLAADENRVAFLYLDGHVREYHGQQPLAKAKKSQRQVARRAATDTWVHDASGEPLLVVTQELNEGLTQVLEPILLNEVRPLVGQRRVTVIFDRGGYSPKLFVRLINSGFDIITYRKGQSSARPPGEFDEQTWEVDGRCYSYRLCDRAKVRVGRLRNKRKKESPALGCQFLWMREVRVLRGDGRQTPILTNREDLSAVEVAYRAFDRWRQENYFKYAEEEFALDALVEYGAEDVSSELDRPNPARKRLQKELSKARAEVSRLRAELGEATGTCRTRTMRGFKMVNVELRRELEVAETRVATLKDQYSQLPARVAANDLKTLTTEKKLITDTIKMSAYQVETELFGLLHGRYVRSLEEGRTLLHAAFQSAGKMELGDGELRISLCPQSSPHRTRAIAQLCDALNLLGACYPGTNLRLRLAIEDQKPADI